MAYYDQSTVDREINTPLFANLDVVDSKLYEVKSLKKQITIDFPLRVSLFVHSLAKFKMLEFVYNCIKKYVPYGCFEFIVTDSFYMALAGDYLISTVLCIYDILSTTSIKYGYADDLALLHSSRYWKGLEETLSQTWLHSQRISGLGI